MDVEKFELPPFDAGAYYDGLHPRLSSLRSEVEFALAAAVAASDIQMHSLSARVKERSS